MASGRSIEVHGDITSERLAEERANDAMQALIEPISRRIIESHGGHLWASANVEQGDLLLHVALDMIAVRPLYLAGSRML
jgi:hypothetical protein